MFRTVNDEIQNIGMHYDSTFNTWDVKVEGKCGWSCVIPNKRIGEFCTNISDVDWSDGEYLNKLKGTYLRVTFDENHNVYSLHHITKSRDYIVQLPI